MVTLIDTQSYETADIPLANGANGLRGICMTADGQYALVAHLLSNFQSLPFRVDMGWINTNVISLIDVKNRKLLATIGIDDFDLGIANPWDICLAENDRTVCVSAAGGASGRRHSAPVATAARRANGNGPHDGRMADLHGHGNHVLVARAACRQRATGTGGCRNRSCTRPSTSPIPSPRSTCRTRPRRRAPSPWDRRRKWSPVRRGEFLFNDGTVCHEHWQSCASCHPDGRGDGLSWDLLNDGAGNPKNTKSNVAVARNAAVDGPGRPRVGGSGRSLGARTHPVCLPCGRRGHGNRRVSADASPGAEPAPGRRAVECVGRSRQANLRGSGNQLRAMSPAARTSPTGRCIRSRATAARASERDTTHRR